ncbi:hypothetical protein GW879_00785, partial [Candidatus Kaiserbacteria bacterium]|nr:hypothetical protein [Candidatus Kaiserbacteria bacterium]
KDRLSSAKDVLRQAETMENNIDVIKAEESLAIARKDRQMVFKSLNQIEGQIAYLTNRVAVKRD